MPDSRANLVGWGYEGRNFDDLVRELSLRRIRTVVDVRLNAVSRKPGFSKRHLSEALTELGVAYVHLPSLGNPKDNREGFAEPQTVRGHRARERFAAEVLDEADAREALRSLAAIAETGPVLVVCFESEQDRCHRSLIIDAASGLLEPTPV